jgi:hypothetical protein
MTHFAVIGPPVILLTSPLVEDAVTAIRKIATPGITQVILAHARVKLPASIRHLRKRSGYVVMWTFRVLPPSGPQLPPSWTIRQQATEAREPA